MAIHTGGGEPNHITSIDAVLAEIEAFTADAETDFTNESYVSDFYFLVGRSIQGRGGEGGLG